MVVVATAPAAAPAAATVATVDTVDVAAPAPPPAAPPPAAWSAACCATATPCRSATTCAGSHAGLRDGRQQCDDWSEADAADRGDLLAVRDRDGLSGDALRDVLETLVQSMRALGVIGDDLCAFGTSYGSHRRRSIQFGLGTDDLLNVEPEAAQALSDPPQQPGRLLLLFDDDVRAEFHRQQALVGEPDVGPSLQRLHPIAAEQRHAGVVDGSDQGGIDACQPHLPVNGFELNDLRPRLWRKERRCGRRNGYSGNQGSDKDLAPIDTPAGAMSLTLDNAQVVLSTFDAILVVRYGNDLARYRFQVRAGVDQELRRDDFEVRPRGKVESQGPGLQD